MKVTIKTLRELAKRAGVKMVVYSPKLFSPPTIYWHDDSLHGNNLSHGEYTDRVGNNLIRLRYIFLGIIAEREGLL